MARHPARRHGPPAPRPLGGLRLRGIDVEEQRVARPPGPRRQPCERAPHARPGPGLVDDDRRAGARDGAHDPDQMPGVHERAHQRLPPPADTQVAQAAADVVGVEHDHVGPRRGAPQERRLAGSGQPGDEEDGPGFVDQLALHPAHDGGRS